MPCGCFGGGSSSGAGGVGKQDPGDKYIPKDGTTPTKPQPITTKPPVVITPIPAPEKPRQQQLHQAPPPVTTAPPSQLQQPNKDGSIPYTDASGQARGAPGPGEDDPDKASRRRDVVASYYSDECELLAYKNTGSRPTSQVGSSSHDGEASPPVATSSPAPSSPASARSAASTRADLVEKRREFFKPLIGDVQEPPWTSSAAGSTGTRSSVGLTVTQQQPGLPPHGLLLPHAQPLLEAHDRQLVNYKEPTVKDVVHKFEHLPEQMTTSTVVGPKPRETEVRLGRNSSTTVVTVLQTTGDKQQMQKPIPHPPVQQQHKDVLEQLTPDQQKQEQQLVNKAAVHQQLLAGGQVNLRPTPPSGGPRAIPHDMTRLETTGPPGSGEEEGPISTTTTTVSDQLLDTYIIQTPAAAAAASPPPPVDVATAAAPAKPPHLPLPSEHETVAQGLQSQPVITESTTLVAESQPIVSETDSVLTQFQPVVTKPQPATEPQHINHEPVLTEPKPVVAEPQSIVAEPQSIVAEPEPVVEEPKPVVEKPQSLVEEPKPIVEEPKAVLVEPESVVAEREPKNVTEYVPKSAVEKRESVLEAEHVSGTVPDFTHSELFTESNSDSFEITQIQDSIIIDTKPLDVDSKPMSAVKEGSFVTQENELISVLKENEKNIFSSQSEQMPLDSHSEITEIIHSQPSYIVESKSVVIRNQENVSHNENLIHGNQQVSFDLGEATSYEDCKSIISKAEPSSIDTLPLNILEDSSQSKHTVEVVSTKDGTTHTETTKSTVTDDDSNMLTHTKTVTTTIISSSEPITEISSTQVLMTEPLYDRTLECINDSSLMAGGSSESSVLITEGSSSPHTIRPNTDMIHEDHQSTLHSLPPMTQIGSSPSPSSSPSPRNSSHSFPASPCASSPSPPASPDSPRTHKLSMGEFQCEQDLLGSQVKDESRDSFPALSQEQSSPEDHNSTLNNQDAPKVQDLKDDILASGSPSSPMNSRNPHTCNEADVTAPVSLEDDGLGSEIDDAMDSMDCLSEEGNSHSHQHHHQPVPAPPPPSSAS